MNRVRIPMILCAALLVCAAAARADKGVLDLIVDPGGPGTWEVRVVVVADDGGPPTSAGLSDFTLTVTATGGATVTSSVNESVGFLLPNYDDPVPERGFMAIRGDGTLGEGIIGLQPISYGTQPDPFLDSLVIQGIGIQPGSDTSVSGPVAWEVPFLLASGTYEGEGWLTAEPSLGASWSLLEDKGGSVGLGWYGPEPAFGSQTSAVESDTESVVPEPATLGVLALGGLAVIRRKRR